MRRSKRPLNLMLDAALSLVNGHKRDIRKATRTVQQVMRSVAKASTHAATLTRRQGDVFDALLRKGPVKKRAKPARPARPTPSGARRTAAREGSIEAGRQRAEGLGRDYKLFVPPGLGSSPRPLVVMLHGCTQDADDFATGTAMNELAAEHRFLVLYPEQSHGANSSGCWNWFKHNHQGRGAGEPAVIAAMVKTVMEKHTVDPRRVYVAGLSAGGAMAAILGDTYPELFAAVGVHSGLPTGAAHDGGTALTAMKMGPVDEGGGIVSVLNPARVTPRPARLHAAPPTIVFHGDRDVVVNPVNGEQVVAGFLEGTPSAAARFETGKGLANGRSYTRRTWSDAAGQLLAEHWSVHGAGHAWSGGRSAGTYTDPKGPSASREMLRFFLDHVLKPVR